jgi:tellurite resistance protein TehA-like permease
MANYVFFGLFVILIVLFIAFFAVKLIQYRNEGFADATEIGQITLYTAISIIFAAFLVAYFRK